MGRMRWWGEEWWARPTPYARMHPCYLTYARATHGDAVGYYVAAPYGAFVDD